MGPLSVGDLMESTVYPFSRMYSLFIEFPTRWIIMHMWKWKACISSKHRNSMKNVVAHNAWKVPKD